MKLTRSKLRRLIKEEISRLVETQVALGLPHEFSNEVLYQHVMNYISSTQGASFDYMSKEYDEAKMLLKILSNRIKELGVYHTSMPDEQDEETKNKLMMARYALARHSGDYRFSGMSRSRKDHYRN